MNQFKTISQLIRESEGEYPDLDRQVASWWKSTVSMYKDNRTSLFKLKEYPKETAMVQKVVSGPKIIVRAFSGSDRNAFVIPGIAPENMNVRKAYNEWVNQHDGKYDPDYSYIPPMCYQMMKAMEDLMAMRKYKLAPAANGKRRIVFRKMDLTINIFVTAGTLTHMSPESRMGIYLHELGHWVDAAEKIPKQMLEDPQRERIYFAFNQMHARHNTRYQEFDADNFAKKMGYGEELATGLGQLVDRRKNVHFFARLNDSNMKIAVDADNRHEEKGKKFNTRGYPSIERRQEWLRDKTKK
tara:strand:+ start:93 stop:986 length:894 start_codon:yes stop_codon:yes gene_type:complete